MRWRATRTARATSMVESCGTLPLPSALGGRAPVGGRRDCLFSVAGPGPASPCRRVQSLRCGGRPAGAASLSMARRLWRLKSFFQTFPVIWRMKEVQKKERMRGHNLMPYVPVSQTAPSPRAAAVGIAAQPTGGRRPPSPGWMTTGILTTVNSAEPLSLCCLSAHCHGAALSSSAAAGRYTAGVWARGRRRRRYQNPQSGLRQTARG